MSTGSCFIRSAGIVLLIVATGGCDSGGGDPERSTGSSNLDSSSSVLSASSSSASSSSSGDSGIPEGYQLVYAVNAGGPATTIGAVKYGEDRFATGGKIAHTHEPVAGASEDTLYKSERFGSYKYEVPVTNASYSVRLHFAEKFHEAPGIRIFDVVVEGEPVVENMDLYAEAGHDTALELTVTDVMVKDESLTIELITKQDNASINGFAIFSNSDGKFVPPTEGCDLPTYLRWTSSPAIVNPQKGYLSVKDPSIVYYGDKYHVFATAFSSTSNFYESIYLSFKDFDEASAAPHTRFAPGGSAVAPQVFYFKPHKRWYIITQWPAKWSSSEDIADPAGWTPLRPFWPDDKGEARHSNALDYWVICNDSTCYMFFFKDDGKMYQVKTPKSDFPKFDIAKVTVADVPSAGPQNILFEAGNVYKIKGHDKYLLMVEGWGIVEKNRLYRAWISNSLDGPWAPYKISENDPFAGLNNVTFPKGQWTHQISHGEMVRAGWDETMELDACNMQFLYQGVDLEGYKGEYNARPYKLGVLTAE